jgi:imidazolonepropionase
VSGSERLLVTNAGPVLTMVPDGGDVLGTRPGAAVLCEGDRITFVGDPDDLDDERREGARVLDAGGAAVLPGLIDCHTHLISAPDLPRRPRRPPRVRRQP